MESVRVDVWVWSVRLFASRSASSTACKGGQVHVNGKRAKASQALHVGDKVEATTPGGPRVVVVKTLLAKRVGAAPAREAYEDHSPPPPPREIRLSMPQRDRGAGRPTKRERRKLEQLRGRDG